MPHFAADFSGTGYRRLVSVHIPSARERNRLRIPQIPVRLSRRLFARTDFRDRRGGLRGVGLRYTPRKASQFTHGALSCPRPRGEAVGVGWQ